MGKLPLPAYPDWSIYFVILLDRPVWSGCRGLGFLPRLQIWCSSRFCVWLSETGCLRSLKCSMYFHSLCLVHQMWCLQFVQHSIMTIGGSSFISGYKYVNSQFNKSIMSCVYTSYWDYTGFGTFSISLTISCRLLRVRSGHFLLILSLTSLI